MQQALIMGIQADMIIEDLPSDTTYGGKGALRYEDSTLPIEAFKPLQPEFDVSS